MVQISQKDASVLLKIARKSISHYLQNGIHMELRTQPASIQRKGASFVTLHLGSSLRGCIGTIGAERPLAEDVLHNAVHAAIHDPRFPPLTLGELNKARISVSVLTEPVRLKVSSPKDLLSKLKPGKTGLVIEIGDRTATYLPWVWDEVSGKEQMATWKEQFLSDLCKKGEWGPDAWKDVKNATFYAYEAKEFHEERMRG